MNSSSRNTSSIPRQRLAGILHQTNKSGELVTSRKIFTGQDIMIGRDSSRCQYVINDPFISNKHLRIYTIVYDDEDPTEVPPLVYAEDLSRNGTYWNRALIGKGNGGFLLSQGDSLRLSSSTLLRFERSNVEDKYSFDLVQENEMKVFRKNYTITDRLVGGGAFGKVYMAVNETHRRQVACKVVDLRKLRTRVKPIPISEEEPAAAEDVDNRLQMRKLAALEDEKKKEHLLEDKLAQWYREADILASISHPNIVGFEKAIVTDKTLYIFQDLVTAGDLFSYLEKKNGRLMEVEAAVIVRQIVIAVKFLHEKNIVHRDIKPDNILMTTLAVGCRVVLTDFGAARRIASHRQRMTSLAGSEGYIAPEINFNLSGSSRGYSKAVDMWSLGCVTVVLLTGSSAFTDPRTCQHSTKLAQNCNLRELERSSEWSEVSARPKAFVGKLLVLDESRRLTANEALEDPWFNNHIHKTDFEELYKRTIRHWQPRVQKKPIVEFMDAQEVKQLQCSQGLLAVERRNRGRAGQTPVEPPYKPFPKQMHQHLFPTRRRSGPLHRFSEEVETVIRDNWTISSSSDESSGSDTHTGTKTAQYLQPRKPIFKALRKSPSLEQTTKRTTAQSNIDQSIGTSSKRQSLGVSYAQHRSKDNENPALGAFSRGSSRPATPRPRIRSRSQDLALRASPPTASLADLPAQLTPRYEVDLTGYETSGSEMIPARNHENASAALNRVEKPLAQSHNGVAETSRFIQSPTGGSSVKANSGPKLRTPKSAGLQSTPVSSSKKRRRSIYDLEDDEEVEDCDHEYRRHRTLWQTASEVFSKCLPNGNEKPSEEEVESALVPRTPSPTRGRVSVYLPRV